MTPVEVSAVDADLPPIVGLAAGNSHCLALRRDGLVVAWGDDEDGQLDVPAGLRDVVAIAAGAYHSLALRADGTVVAWGRWSDGCTDVPSGLQDVVSIAAGGNTSLALCRDGAVVEWGHSFPDERSVPAGLRGVTSIAADGSRLAVTEDGQFVAWGGLLRGAEPPEGLAGVRSIAAGYSHGLALLEGGTVAAWGLKDAEETQAFMKNDKGQADVPPGLGEVTDIAAAGWHSLALLKDGTVVAWGSSTGGHRFVPPGLRDVVAIAAGSGCSMAAKVDGSIVVWGDARYGQRDVPDLMARMEQPKEETRVFRRPADLQPVVQSMSGNFSFLHGPLGPYGSLTTGGRAEPFPDEESLRTVLRAARGNRGHDRYVRGRVASNLAAVCICNGKLAEALEAIQESESTFVELIKDPAIGGLEDWVLTGLAAARYNASLIFYRAGDIDRNYEYARVNLENAARSLASMRVRDAKWRFLDSALKGLQ